MDDWDLSAIPEELFRNERPVVESFQENEKLYRRVPPNLVKRNRPAPAAMEPPDVSCQRSSLQSSPNITLQTADCQKIDTTGWGVCAIRISDLPREVVSILRTYVVRPQHRPHKYNYPHSEISLFDNKGKLDQSRIAELRDEDSLRFRNRLAQLAKWEIQPVVRR